MITIFSSIFFILLDFRSFSEIYWQCGENGTKARLYHSTKKETFSRNLISVDDLNEKKILGEGKKCIFKTWKSNTDTGWFGRPKVRAVEPKVSPYIVRVHRCSTTFVCLLNTMMTLNRLLRDILSFHYNGL